MNNWLHDLGIALLVLNVLAERIPAIWEKFQEARKKARKAAKKAEKKDK